MDLNKSYNEKLNINQNKNDYEFEFQFKLLIFGDS